MNKQKGEMKVKRYSKIKNKTKNLMIIIRKGERIFLESQ